jgi:hypothetical protein
LERGGGIAADTHIYTDIRPFSWSKSALRPFFVTEETDSLNLRDAAIKVKDVWELKR